MKGSYIIGVDTDDYTAHLRSITAQAAGAAWRVVGVDDDLVKFEAALRLKYLMPDRPRTVTIGPGRGKVTSGVIAYAARRMVESDEDGDEGTLYCAEQEFGAVRPARGSIAAEILAETRGLVFVGLSDEESRASEVSPDPFPIEPDLAEVASSGRNILLVGRPGSGKTMRARRIGRPGVLGIDVCARILEAYSCAGLATSRSRPFRAPHHTVSTRGLKAEAHLATGGVLFLDEVTEFSRLSIETLVGLLRQMPDEFRPQIVMAANPCACGWQGTSRRCACGAETLTRYEKWIWYVADLFNAVVFNNVAEHFHPARFERKEK